MGRTNIYYPLKNIYESNLIDEVRQLPKNIILLTDGEIVNKELTLQLIEKNNSLYNLFLILILI